MRISPLLSLLLCIAVPGLFKTSPANATHLRAGEIIVERINCSGNTFRIKIIVYTDTEEGVIFGGAGTVLDFGDGNILENLPEIDHNINAFLNPDGSVVILSRNTEDLGENVATTSITLEYTYSSALPSYIIGYTEPNRNRNVLNIDNSVETTFHIETQITLDASLGCNNSPVLQIPPIDRACPGVAFFHNPGAFDPDGDSLAFELVIPKRNAGALVDGYEDPNDPIFYENFNQGNELQNGPPTFAIDPLTGEVSWDAPDRIGEYNIAFLVREYRFRFGEWFPLGFVRRDMQIVVVDCDNERPELTDPKDICVEAGTVIDETIFGTDPDGDDVIIEVFSQVLGDDFGAEVIGNGERQSSIPRAEVQFRWETECADIRNQPYQVAFKITDQPENGPNLVSFETWNITVIGPKPQLNEVVQDGQALRLNWDSYACQNADEIQIWRRVDSNPYVPDECETGIRENAGYALIGTVSEDVTTYRDEDLAAAAKYCYRLVAVFLESSGAPVRNVLAESIASDEVCFEFVPAEEPVITHVSVRRTDEVNGEIIVAWHAPLDSGTLTPPFTYRIERAEGFSGETNLTLVDEITVTDLDPDIDSIGFTDTGLNTLDLIYNYRITLLDPDSDDDLVSATASSVRLEATPEFGQIQLDWTAEVPWSNQIPFPPGSQHIVYRGFEGDTDEDMEFLAAVDVSQSGFTFTDANNLEEDQVYCYRVLTKGTYGNPEIQGPELRPLFNFSQRVCAQPSDTIPPCAPVLTLDGPDCENFTSTNTCSFNDFRNELTWTTDFIGDCKNDIEIYEIFYAPTTDSEFTKIAEATGDSFVHEGLPSFKGCYRIRAIDRSGNESEFSNTFCADNCPYYELPNVFTPNGDLCNELFSAYSDTNFIGEDGGLSNDCGIVDATKCARFVLSVNFTVYNRWGRPVYHYEGRTGTEPVQPGLRPELINWDGRGDNGGELSAGVYYYLAEVIFDTVDPGNAKQEIKGWVQIIR